MPEQRKYVIYKHTAPNGKCYIGQTCQNPEDRWAEGEGYWYNSHFARAISKYGWGNFQHEILVEGLSFDEANLWEKKLIADFHSADPKHGYNMTEGGQGTPGHKLSDASKERLRRANLGKRMPDDVKRKISESARGRILSAETRRKMSDAKKRSSPGADARSRAVVCIETGQAFRSSREAGRWLGSTNCVSKACLDPSKTIRGYHFAFADDEKAIEALSEWRGKPAFSDKARYEAGRSKCGISSRKSVICIDTGEAFSSLNEACKAHGMKMSNLSTHLNKPTAYCTSSDGRKLHWRYFE